MKLPDCMMPDGADPCAGYVELMKNSGRYEKLRKLTPLQFSALYQRNLEFGIPFDELIDEL